MNVFVLCTGRCGSVTFEKACTHLDNYSASHESQYNYFVPWRFEFPDAHIEIDYRLAWYLGVLDEQHPDAFYVHLTRAPHLVAESYHRKLASKGKGQGRAWYEICGRPLKEFWPHAMLDMVTVVNANIRHFLKDKAHMTIDIAEGAEKFPDFCGSIGATGDIDASIAEFSIMHNAA